MNAPCHSSISPLSRLQSLLAPEKSDIWIILIYGICSGTFSLIIPIAVQTLVNTIAFGSVVQPVVVLTFLVLLVLGFSAITRALQIYIMEIIQQRIFARTAMSLSIHIPKIELRAIEGKQGPELINLFFDVLTVQKTTALIVLDGLSLLLQTGVGMILLAFYHPYLLAFDFLLIVMILGIIFLLGRGAVHTSIVESKTKYQVAGWLEELARLPILFKHPAAKPFILENSDRLTSEHLKSRKYHFKILMRQIVATLSLQVLASAILLGLGGWLVIRRQLTLGQLVAAELVVTSVVTGVGKFGKYLESFYDLLAAADKLGYLLELPVEERHSVQLPPSLSALGSSGPSIRLEEVDYAYSDHPPCLKKITFDVKPNQKIIIQGSQGSGKSTLCDILYRLRLPQTGLILVDGVSTKDQPLFQYRSKTSFLRNIEIFEGNLLDQFRVHHALLDTQKIYENLTTVGLLPKIQQLPSGLRTLLSGEHSFFSSSEAKLLTLARALTADSRFFIVDCFLDDLDELSREKALGALLESPATVVITTRLTSLSPRIRPHFILSSGELSYA